MGDIFVESDSVLESSEELIEYCCSPCQKAGKQCKAEGFCSDCNESLCRVCLDFHNRFSSMQGHRILTEAQMRQQQMQGNILPLSKTMCDLHPGSVVCLFCEDHDVVCCNACVAVSHRLCRSVSYIPKKAKGFSSSTSISEVRTSITKALEDISKIKEKTADTKREVAGQMKYYLDYLVVLKEEILNKIDQLEKLTRENIHSHYHNLQHELNSRTNQVDDIESKLEDLKKGIEKYKDDDSNLFVTVKTARGLIQNVNSIFQKYTANTQKTETKVYRCEDLHRLLDTLTSLGQFVEECDINVKMAEDSSACDISDICETESGDILVADHGNSCLKVLDVKSNLVTRFPLFAKPGNICFMDGTTFVAVCFESSVKYYNIYINNTELANSIQTVHYFNVGFLCSGIAYGNEQFYVSCLPPNASPRVCVFSKTGKLLKATETTGFGVNIFIAPNKITLSPDGNHVYVADNRQGVVFLDKEGRYIEINRIKKRANGLCTSTDDSLYVCESYTNTIVRINKNRTHTVLLTDKCGLKRPMSLCMKTHGVAPNRNTILVSMAMSENIKLYSFHQ